MEALNAMDLAKRLQWEAQGYWLHLEADSSLEKYPAKQHARRVQEKLGVEQGLIYLLGQPAKTNEDSDMPAPYRQRRYFYYLSGCNEAGCHVIYNIEYDTLTLFIPRIDENRVIWYGRGSTPTEALDKYDVDEVHYVDELPDFIHNWSKCHKSNRRHLYVLHTAQTPQIPQLDAVIDSTSLQPAMNLARMIKDDHEIKLIRKANDISSEAHREVLANILKFRNEAQVQGLFMDVCISQQAKEQAYDPIAASGPNAGTLHYDANNEDFDDRQLMCLDAGCEYELYASDITRTFPLSPSWPSSEAENTYKLVQRMQETCIERLAPGVRYLDLHILAHQIAIDGLLQLGILHNGTKEEIYKAGTSKAFFPHGLGHHVGLEVHDVGQADLMSVWRGKAVLEQAPSLYPEAYHLPVYDPKACHAPTDPQSSHLEEGMVVTVEPGIYFSLYALQHFYFPSPIHSKYINAKVVQRYLPVGGVRIEDDILITSKGYENLTTAPKGEAMLEIIRNGKTHKSSARARETSPQKSISNEALPLVRAPGISRKIPEPILKPISRATTMSTEMAQQSSVDFEPFNGPSLFSNFRRSMTTDDNVQRWRRAREESSAPRSPPKPTRQPTPVCGELSFHVEHVYMSNTPSLAPSSHQTHESETKPMCQKCVILVRTLGRLRRNLVSATGDSPVLSHNPAVELATTRKELEMPDGGAASAKHGAMKAAKAANTLGSAAFGEAPGMQPTRRFHDDAMSTSLLDSAQPPRSTRSTAQPFEQPATHTIPSTSRPNYNQAHQQTYYSNPRTSTQNGDKPVPHHAPRRQQVELVNPLLENDPYALVRGTRHPFDARVPPIHPRAFQQTSLEATRRVTDQPNPDSGEVAFLRNQIAALHAQLARQHIQDS